MLSIISIAHAVTTSSKCTMAHSMSERTGGMRDLPVSVREYSTRGGTSAYTSRCTRWLCSRFFKVCESIDVDSRNYDRIVAAIVTDHYSSDAYQALIANYQMAKDPEAEISEEKRSEYIQEYESFQAWRAHAKEVAHIVVTEIESM